MSVQQSSGGVVDSVSAIQGAIFGAIAFVAGYALTYLLLVVDSEVDFNDLAGQDLMGTTDVVAWVFYNAHFVDVESSAEGMGETGSETVNLIADSSYQFPDLLYYLVPVVVLVAAGYVLVDRLDAVPASSGDAARAGAWIVAGYLPLAAIAAYVFTVSETQEGFGESISVSMGPELVMAIAVAGIVFPLVLGAVGGYIAFSRQ